MAISASDVKELRERTGAGMMDCKKALQETSGDMEKAVNLLREKGIAVAAKRETKAASEGVVGSYIHTGGQIGVMVELNCETSFVAKTDEFQGLARDIAMQIAWGEPRYISRTEIPENVIIQEQEVNRQWAINEGKPEAALDKIVTGRMEKFYAQVCLLDQAFIRDEDKTVQDIINDVMGKLGEKIVLSRFIRYRVGEQG
ncbi:MAG: translation elongation factor Ts [Armatimonadota bacterium]|nr:translation elongation factor Ts [Armatimonadota bacterium]